MKRMAFLVITAVFCGCVLAEESDGKTKKPDPNPDRQIMLAASKAHKDKDYEKALALWQRLEKKIDSNFQEIAVFGIGQVLQEQGKYDEAIKQYAKLFVTYKNESDSKVIPNNRQKADGEIQTAVCYMYKGEYKKALKALKFADNVYPYHSWCGTCQASRKAVTPTYQGICYENLKNYHMALHYYFKIAFDDYAFNTAVEFRIFDLYESQGQLDSLKKILDQVDKKHIEKHIAKNGADSVEKESFKKNMPTGKIRYYMKNPELSIKRRNQSYINNFRGVYFPPLPKKVELPTSLQDITITNINDELIKTDTTEMIQLLERAKIRGVSVYHSQEIHIRLMDGSSFIGKYVHAEAGKYSDDKELSDGYNLVMQIKKNRRSEDVKDWIIKRQ